MGNCAGCYQTEHNESILDENLCVPSDYTKCDTMQSNGNNEPESPDLSHHINCDKCDPSDYTKCDAMLRLITSSQQYSTFQTNKSEDSDELLIRFMNEVYNEKSKRLIDDYIHFQKHHEHELERINHDLIEAHGFSDCSIGECDCTKRHMHHDQQSTSISANDVQLLFYGDLFDGLHFHLSHCFEAGLRVRRNDDNDQMEEEKED
eukprot:655605_1